MYVPGPALTAPGGTVTPSIHAERAKAQSADFGLTVLALKAMAAAACSMRSATGVSWSGSRPEAVPGFSSGTAGSHLGPYSLCVACFGK